MNSIVRACGVAAAAAGCLVAATTAQPSFASNSEGVSIVSAIEEHSIALIGNDYADHAEGWKGNHRSLDQLVAAYADTQVRDREQECLANAVYFEARGEPIDGQLAVADVVLNRAASGKYPRTICKVVTQPWQFSFIRNGRFPKADRSSVAWRKAVGVANVALGKVARKLPSDVLWYHADYVAPSWGKRLNREAKIGLHIFYS